MYVGFSGNNLQGISMILTTSVLILDNLLIPHLQSDYGEGWGISVISIATDASSQKVMMVIALRLLWPMKINIKSDTKILKHD